MKKTIPLFISIILLVSLISCKDSNRNYIVIDASKDAGSLINIPSSAKVRIVNMNRYSQYVVDSSSGSRSLSRDMEENAVDNPSSGGLLQAGENHYLTVPSKNDECAFTPDDANIAEGGEITISILPPQTNIAEITTNDPIVDTFYFGGLEYNKWEGYCNIDFDSEFYANLDRSKVILVRDFEAITPGPMGAGNGMGMDFGIIYDSKGVIEPEEFRGVLDLSDAGTVKLYNSMTFYNTYNLRSRLYLMNPVEITSEPKTVATRTKALSFPRKNDGKNYILKVVVDGYVGVPAGPGGVIVAREFDGNDYRQLYPAISDSQDTQIWILGELDKEMLIDFDYEAIPGSGYFTISIEEDPGVELRVRPLVVSNSADSISIDIPAGRISEAIQIKAAEGFKTDRLEIVSVLTNKQGEFPSTGDMYTSAHGNYNGSVCTSTADGFYGQWWAWEEYNVLDLVIYGYVEEDCTLTVSIRQKDEEKEDFTHAQVSLCPYPGSEIVYTEVPMYSKITIPSETREGYSFLGYLYNSELHQPGEEVEIYTYVCSLTGVWQKILKVF